jgi:secondary thiamine-phosphate synthase enzyme
METQLFPVVTGRRLVTDLTATVRRFCCDRGDGLCHVYVPHATAGIALMEIGSGSEVDLDAMVRRLLPKSDIYRHRHGSLGHGGDHLLGVVVSPSLVLPVVEGEVLLGTWQSVVLVDPNEDNPERLIRLSFLSDH